MQIIAGKHRGRKLETVRTNAVRPTSGRTREAIFNIILHGLESKDGGHPLLDRRVADIYCGSGAFGLEALSRGAAHATFVDNAKDVIAIARSNAERFGESENVRFALSDATHLPSAHQPYDLIFLDPPYHENLVTKTLASLLKQGWVDENTVVIAEMHERAEPEIPAPLSVFDERSYGQTKVMFLRNR